MRPAVSPACTVTPSVGAGRGAAVGRGAEAVDSTARGARTAGAEGVAAEVAGAEIWGDAVTLGAARRRAGGSNSMV